MADPIPGPRERLDSWKAIGDYLKRDIATARRWEKSLGLPVRRVPGGRGRSVFAYTDEIDAWLETSHAASSDPPPPPAPPRPWHTWVALGILIAAVVGVAWQLRPVAVVAGDLRIETTGTGVTAFDPDGRERWRFAFPSEYQTAPIVVSPTSRLVTGDDPGVYVATSHRLRREGNVAESGALYAFDLAGRLGNTFSFGDEVTFHGMKYGAPWAITAFAVEGAGDARRVAVASHHWLWDPSLVTVLDHDWKRTATFVHAGWVEQLNWLSPDRLLIGGFSEAHNGGMVALLDPARMNGQGPEAPGTRFYCDSCAADRPLRMIVMPRSEVNLASLSRFNRAIVEVTNERVIVRTVEVPSDEIAADALYEFTPSLDLISASFSTRYWDIHRQLEMEGKLDHTREQCPDRDGPREILVWESQAGWRTVVVR